MSTRRGFTLVEITIALVIFVLAITSILAMYAVAAASHRQATRTTQIRLAARRLLAEVHAQNLGTGLPKAVKDKVFPDYDGRYSYDVAYRPVAMTSDGIPQAYHVTITLKETPAVAGELPKVLEIQETVILRRLEQ